MSARISVSAISAGHGISPQFTSFIGDYWSSPAPGTKSEDDGSFLMAAPRAALHQKELRTSGDGELRTLPLIAARLSGSLCEVDMI